MPKLLFEITYFLATLPNFLCRTLKKQPERIIKTKASFYQFTQELTYRHNNTLNVYPGF